MLEDHAFRHDPPRVCLYAIEGQVYRLHQAQEPTAHAPLRGRGPAIDRGRREPLLRRDLQHPAGRGRPVPGAARQCP